MNIYEYIWIHTWKSMETYMEIFVIYGSIYLAIYEQLVHICFHMWNHICKCLPYMGPYMKVFFIYGYIYENIYECITHIYYHIWKHICTIFPFFMTLLFYFILLYSIVNKTKHYILVLSFDFIKVLINICSKNCIKSFYNITKVISNLHYRMYTLYIFKLYNTICVCFFKRNDMFDFRF